MSYTKDHIITTQSASLSDRASYFAYVGKTAIPIIPPGRIRPPGTRDQYVGTGEAGGGAPYTAVVGTPSSNTFPFGNICYDGDWYPGKIGNYSLSFDGTNDYITAGTVSDFAWMHGKEIQPHLNGHFLVG